MKNILLSLMLGLVMLSVSGCSYKTAYNKDYIDRQINTNLSKVSESKVTIVKESQVVDSVADFSLTFNISTGSIKTHIAKEFFKQYFDKVVLVKPSDIPTEGLVIETSLDIEYFSVTVAEGATAIFSLNIVALNNNKEILNKTYKVDKNLSGIQLGMGTSNFEEPNELLHKEIMNIFETKFKEDLLIALRNEE